MEPAHPYGALMATIDTPLTDAEAFAAQNLYLACRHARLLERLGVLLLVLSALALLVLATSDALAPGLGVVVGAILAWATLRAIALRLHLLVDQALLAE